MFRIPMTNQAVVGGSPDAAAQSTAGSQPGRFGRRQVSQAPKTGVLGGGYSSAETQATTSGAAAAGRVPERPGILPPPAHTSLYRSPWKAFFRWCEARNEPHWPARPEAVAKYLRERCESHAINTLRNERSAISTTYSRAGIENPCTTGLVKATMKELARAMGEHRERRRVSCDIPLDAAKLEAIRASALERRPWGRGLQGPAAARQRGLVDLALCSLVLEAGLLSEEVAALEWRDLTVADDGGAGIKIATGRDDGGTVVAISERTFGDLEAIAGRAESGGKVFGLCRQTIDERIRAAAHAAGVEFGLVRGRRRRRAVAQALPQTHSSSVRDTRLWKAFCRWCDEQGKAKLPACGATVAQYLRDRAQSVSAGMVTSIRSAIARAHRNAGFDNPCATHPVETTIQDLHRASPALTATTLNPAAVMQIRKTALEPRRRGGGTERAATARQRGLVDIAACSVMLAARLTERQAADLEWRDLEKSGEGDMRLTVRLDQASDGGTRTVTLTGQAVRDLEAIQSDAVPEAKVFALGASGIRRRIKKAARAAGLGESFAVGSPGNGARPERAANPPGPRDAWRGSDPGPGSPSAAMPCSTPPKEVPLM